MKSWIEEAVSIAEIKVRNVFKEEFSKLYNNLPTLNRILESESTIKIHEIACHEDLAKATNNPGFYIILSSYKVKCNSCNFSFNDLVAIYRGECEKVRKRIQSHLFNKLYQLEYNKRKEKYQKKHSTSTKPFYEQFWPACMKLEPGVNGININKIQYNSYKWLVIVHEMKGSGQPVRKQAELAFDELFGKPIACREK